MKLLQSRSFTEIHFHFIDEDEIEINHDIIDETNVAMLRKAISNFAANPNEDVGEMKSNKRGSSKRKKRSSRKKQEKKVSFEQ